MVLGEVVGVLPPSRHHRHPPRRSRLVGAGLRLQWDAVAQLVQRVQEGEEVPLERVGARAREVLRVQEAAQTQQELAGRCGQREESYGYWTRQLSSVKLGMSTHQHCLPPCSLLPPLLSASSPLLAFPPT